jgi:hypothetical protein
MAFETKESLASELVTFVDNEGDLYRGQTTSILRNLVTKMARGDYNREKAVEAFMHLAESGAKKYAKDSTGSERGWHEMFPIDVRRLAATHWRDSFEGEARLGNYDDMLPKKYQEGGSTGKSPDYQAGAEHAQLVAKYAPKSAIQYILAWKQVFPQARRHIPEIAHLPLPKNSKKPAFKQGFLQRLRAIFDAMEGN